MGSFQIQSTRPQTLGYGLTDSPVAQLAWIVEKFQEWTDPAATLPEDAVDRDQLLTKVTLYWLGRLGGSTAHFTHEIKAELAQPAREPAMNAAAASVPVGVAEFATDPALRSVVDPAHSLTHWTRFARGGHFPAMEQPHLLTGDLRAFFAPLRRPHC